MPKPENLLFRVSLAPDIWREIELSGSSSLYTFARGITEAYRFAFDHCFGFFSKLDRDYHRSPERYELFNDIGEDVPGSLGVKHTRVAAVFPEIGKKMLFMFDYGDEWHFTVELIGRTPRQAGVRYPCVGRSRGNAPPQYPSGDDDPDYAVH